MKVTVYESTQSRERFEVEVPLFYSRDISELRAELGLPEFVVLESLEMANAIGILWASQRASDCGELLNKRLRLPTTIPAVVFGGLAVRLLCPSANPPGPLARKIGDIDIATGGSHARDLVSLLCVLGDILGSRLIHWQTKSDVLFNNLRRGRRYRVHRIVDDPTDELKVGSGVLDIFVDCLRFCHDVTFAKSLAAPMAYQFTIGATEMLLSKLQYIRTVPDEVVPGSERYRVIGRIGSDAVLGPEEKDLVDASALLADCGVGNGPLRLDLERMERLFRSDRRLAKTVRMNLANEAGFQRVLAARVVPPALTDALDAGRHVLIQLLDSLRWPATLTLFDRFSKTWWEQVEDV